MKKTLVMLYKEWLELKRQRWMLIGLASMPIFFALMPIAITYIIRQAPPSPPDPQTAELVKHNALLQGMTEREISQTIIGQQFAILLLIVPLLVPSIIASYSIVGEKNSRTLEPILVTPIKTWELLLSKSLASLIPSIILTGVASLIFITGMAFTALTPQVFSAIVSIGWLIVLIGCSPSATLISISLIVAVSSRVSDPRSAQQISGLLILPVMGLLFGQIFGVLILSPLIGIVMAIGLGAFAALAIVLTVQIFQRETILTRWG